MSLLLIKSLVNNFQVCRFCLLSNPDELVDIYESILGTTIFSINTTIRNVLYQLGIQVTQNDPYPNRICQNCRDVLFSINNFRETAQKSIRLLDKAKLLKEFPTVRFEDVPEEISNEDPLKVICKDEEDVPEVEPIDERLEDEDDVPEVESIEELVENCDPSHNDDQSEETLAESADGQSEEENLFTAEANRVNEEETIFPETNQHIKAEVNDTHAEPTEAEYNDTEWLVYEGEEEVLEEQYEDTETIYLDEAGNDLEIEQGSIKSEPKKSVKSKAAAVKKSPKAPPLKQCPVCGITSTAMVVHMRTHTKTKPFICELCKKGFYTSNKLRCHVQSVHHGVRNFMCDICDKRFVMKKTLNAHMMSHLSEKSHVCPVCSKSFLFRWALAKHQRTHTGERPFTCTLDGCGKSFVTSSNLRQHQKTNAHWKKPRDSGCAECGKEFQNKYALRAHLKTHEQRRVKEENCK